MPASRRGLQGHAGGQQTRHHFGCAAVAGHAPAAGDHMCPHVSGGLIVHASPCERQGLYPSLFGNALYGLQQPAEFGPLFQHRGASSIVHQTAQPSSIHVHQLGQGSRGYH
eukprot:5746590-Lingulodinium_polyedra.AAC.1